MAFAIPTEIATVTPIRNHPEKATKPVQCLKRRQPVQHGSPPKRAAQSPDPKGAPQEAHISKLQRLLGHLISVFWVSKWVDYTENYGLGYQLCDNSIGVVFNDSTRAILLNDSVSVTYVDEDCIEHYHSLVEYPPSLENKMTLLKYFCAYMKKLLMTGKKVSSRKRVNLVRLPCLRTWLRTRSAMAFYLTNGTVQINFFFDHTKLILCPLRAAVTYMDRRRLFHTYRLETLCNGCPPELFCRLKYARTILDRLTSLSS
ncbi:hypothetical protein MTO96_002371 [Rhipicephalus appendiculatus]